MSTRITIGILLLCAATVPAFGGGTVTLDLASPSSGGYYRGDAPAEIQWSITAAVSAGDNMGLACLLVDLVQDAGNPQAAVLTPASGVPSEMVGFDRPAGISNPGNGYVGTQVVYAGLDAIVQIGGAQNNFGGLPEPAVSGFGEDFLVDANVGQSGQLIASGSFVTPQTLGAYTVQLQNPIANTFDMVNEPPKWSPVSSAVVQMGSSGGAVSFVLCVAADADGDQNLTSNDITVFVDLLLGNTAADPYAMCTTDLNDDGQIDGVDIHAFVQAFLAG
jgi:hypothetical protein